MLLSCRSRMKRAHSIGASVSDTKADTAIEAVTVRANSRKTRPMIPPMSNSGMNTATSDRLIDSTVNAISREPSSAALNGGGAVFDVAVDVLDHHDGVVDHEADRDGEPHQRNVVEAEIAAYIAANEPSNASGTVRLGMNVAQKSRRNNSTTSTTSAMVSTSVNSTSCTEARIVTVRSSMVSTFIAAGILAVSLRQLRLDEFDRVDDVGAGQLADRQQDAGLVVGIAGDVAAGRLEDRLADIAHPQRSAVAIGQDHVVERLGLDDLVVGRDRVADLDGDRSCPWRRCVVALTSAGPDLLQRQADGGKLRRIDLDADRRLLVADDRGLGDAGHLRQRLDEDIVEVFVDRGKRQRIGMRPQHHDRRVRRIDLAVDRRIGHRLRQELARSRDRRLDVLGGEIDVAVEIELDDDLVAPSALSRGQLRDARDLAELALQAARRPRTPWFRRWRRRASPVT